MARIDSYTLDRIKKGKTAERKAGGNMYRVREKNRGFHFQNLSRKLGLVWKTIFNKIANFVG
jgi:hypothetical protein